MLQPKPKHDVEALKMAYDDAKKQGYSKDINSFHNLLKTDKEALSMAYDDAKKQGYGKSIDDFQSLFGVEKKNSNQTTSTSTYPNQKLDSVQKVGSSDIQKSQNKTLPVDEFGVTNFNQPKTQPKVETAPIVKKQPLVQADSLGTTDFGKTPFTPETDLNVENFDKAKSIRKDYSNAIYIPEEKNAEFEQEYNAKVNNEGFVNKAKTAVKNWWNNVIDVEPALQVSTDHLVEEKKQAKDELKKELDGKEPTPEQLQKRTKEIFVAKKKGDYQQSLSDSYLESLSDEDRQLVEVKLAKELPTLDKDYVNKTNSFILLGKDIDAIDKELAQMERIVKEQSEMGNNNLDPKFYEEAKRLEDLRRNKIIVAKSMDEELYKSKAKLGSALEEYDNFKRSYGDFDVLANRLKSGIADIGYGLASFKNYVNRADRYFGTEIEGITPEVAEIEKSEKEVDFAKKVIDKEQEYFRKRVKEVNGIGDFINYTTDVVGDQIPNMLPFMLTGGLGGGAVIFGSGTGNQYAEMIDGEINQTPFSRIYTDEEKVVAPFVFGVSDAALSAIPTWGRMLRGKRTIQSALKEKGGVDLFAKSSLETAKKGLLRIGKDNASEQLEEQGANLIQNFTKVVYLKEEGATMLDGVEDVFKDTATFSTLLSAFPVAMGGVIKSVSSADQISKFDENAKQIIALKQRLSNSDLSVSQKSIIQSQIDKKTVESKKMISDIQKKFKNKGTEILESVNDVNRSINETLTKAKEIKDSNLPKSEKEVILDGLKQDYSAGIDKREKLLSDKSTILDTLSDSEQIKLKDKAQRELRKELEAKGETKIELNDEQITKKAVELYEESKPKAVVEQKPETQPQAEKQAEIVEIEQPQSNNNQINEVNENVALQDNNEEIPNPSQIKNEATPGNITPTDGNVQLGVGEMADMGVKKQPTAQVVEKENIQPANEAGSVEIKNKVEDIDINDIENFLNEMYSKNNKNENNKPTADKGNERAESNSAEQNIGEPKSEEKAKKISLKGRTPIAKRKFKGDRAKANAVEPTDVYSLVLNYFVSGGKIGSASVKSLLKSDSEVKARNNGFNGISKKSAKEINDLAHDLWELALSLGIQTDTQLVKDAIENVVSAHNTNQDITNTILKRNNLEVSEEDKIKKLEDYYIAQAVFDQVQEQNDASDEEMQEAQSALDMLSDAEIIELANNQSKSYDDYLKDLEERRVTFNIGPFEEIGTVQSDGSIINDEGEIFSKESVSNVKQVNPKPKKEKITKVPTGVTGKGTKNVSASAKSLLKEIDKKIEDARQNVRIAKEALDRKAKSLDKEMTKDQENLFGERKSSNEDKLFDERVNANARNKATESERNAIKIAQDELKKLIQTKKDVENGKITSNQVDLEDVVNQENKKLSDQVRKLKIDLSKLSGGGLQSNPLGLPAAVWNASMDIIATSIDAGMGLAEAIKRGLNYIQKNHRGAWNKKQFNDEVLKELGVRGITINGEDLIVKDTNKEFAETINGFYSDIEQSLIDTKKDNLTAEEWETVVGKSDEAKFTGLNDWLSENKGEYKWIDGGYKFISRKISKSDIRKFLKENRIEIVEIVKGQTSGFTEQELIDKIESKGYSLEYDMGGDGYMINDKEGEIVEYDELPNDVKEWYDLLAEITNPEETAGLKYAQYQLEGEKENYKEVLVTLPKKSWNDEYKNYLIEKYGENNYYNMASVEERNKLEDVKFKSSHFDEPNILVHLRMNTRTDVDGNKVLFLEEIQSDWGQQGKREGFDNKQLEKKRNDLLEESYQIERKENDNIITKKVANTGRASDYEISYKDESLRTELAKRKSDIQKEIDEINQKTGIIPDAPFVTDTNSWAKLGVKVALKEAVNQNVDKIAWTTGEQQNERYDLSKTASSITHLDRGDGTYIVEVFEKGTSRTLWQKNDATLKEIEDTVGKDIANKIKEGEGNYETDLKGEKISNTRVLKGDDLKVGGKGMKGFYGSTKEGKLGIIGEVVKALTKQDVKTIDIQVKEDDVKKGRFINPTITDAGYGMVRDTQNNNEEIYSPNNNRADVENWLRDKKSNIENRKDILSTQNSISITPELKSEVKKGMPMFGNLKDQQKAMVNAEVDKIAQKVKDLLPGIKDTDLNAQGFTQDQLIDLIASAVKNLIAAGIDINEAIKQVVESIKDKFGIDVNPDDVKAKLKSERNKNFKKESGKKSVLGRAVSGGEPLNITEEIEKYGLDYEVESQAKAQENAKEFVKAVGRKNALIAVRSGQIKGAEKAFVYAEIIDGIVKEMDSVSIETPDRIALNAQHSTIMGEIMNEFDIQSREAGRFISALNRVYFSTYFKYNLSRQINLYKARNGGEISPEKLQEYKETDARLKELERKIEEAEKRAEEAEAKLAMENIVEEVERTSKKQKPDSNAKKAKILAEKIRRGKINRPGIFMSATPASLVWDGAIEVVAKLVEAEVKLSDAIKKGMDYIKKSSWYQSLSDSDKNEAEKSFEDHVRRDARPAMVYIDEDGNIKVPESLIRSLVEQGVKDIDELSQKVLDTIIDEYPDLTLRQVRDAITKYGKTINPDPDTISTEVRKLKRLGKLISGLEDAKSGKRPLKSGLQRDEITQLERKLKRELKDLLRDLPLDDDSVKKTWKTALDAIKSRLRNQIEDLEKQIANKEKSKPEKTPIEYDEEANELRQRRDNLKETLESIVGKPELSEEKKIIKAIAMLEKSIQNLNDQIADNNIAYKTKPTPVTSARIEELKKQKAELIEQIKQMRIDSGIAEARRLQSAKSRIKNRIAELEKRIKEKNYTTKKPTVLKADQELLDLQAEKIRVQEVYDKDKYIDELKNRTDRQKRIDAILGLWNIPRVVMATGELSWIFIQGGIQTVNRTLKNPVQMFKIFKKMFKAMASDSKAKEYESLTKSNKNYLIMKQSKLALTEVDHKLEAKEEQFLGDYANTVWDFIGVGLRKLSKNKEYRSPFSYFRQMLGKELNSADKATLEQYWKNINPLRILERGNTVYMNELRMARFLEGVEMLQSELKDPIEDIEDYKMLASAINTMTGRANIGSLQANSKILAAIFFSFRNAVSVFNQLNPIFYLYQLHNPKDPITKVSVAQKIAVADMMRFVTFTTGMMLLLQAAMGDDEEGNPKMTIETDPRSSDFGKMKMGDLRIDPWHGMMPMIVLISRMFTDESKNVNTGEVTAGGTKFGTRTRNELAVDFITNKFNPSMGILWGYGSSHKVIENGVEIRKDMFGNEINVLDEVANLQPMYWDAISEIKKEQPGLWGDFFVAAGALGINSQVYDKPKPKTSTGFNRPRRPSFERPKRP